MKLRPHHILLASGLLLLVITFFIIIQTTDAYVYDTYSLVGLTEYYMVLSFLLLFVGLLYWWFRRFFYSWFLTWLHVSIHLLSVLLAAILPLFVESFTEARSYRSSGVNVWTVYLVVGVWIVSQVIFLYHVFVGYQKHRRR